MPTLHSRQNKLASQIPDILNHFGLKLYRTHRGWSGCCPIHGGDNSHAFVLYDHGNFWKCYTANCDEEYGHSLPGLIRGILSEKHGQLLEWRDVYEYIENQDWAPETDEEYISSITRPEPIPADQNLVNTLDIPCHRFIKQGFSRKILEEYRIGRCVDPNHLLYNRTVFPIWNRDKNEILGYCGRSIFNQCSKCLQYHAIGRCPYRSVVYAKWINSKGFSRNTTLFGAWSWQCPETVILTEGPKDVLRLNEVGFHNSAAIFGTSISKYQLEILKGCKTQRLILCFDNDEAGIIACKKIVEQCKKDFHIEIPKLGDYSDIGEIPVKDKFWGHLHDFTH